MNKIAIPALLLGVVMIAGAFAFMPVQEASTVHTTAATTSNQMKLVTVSDTCAIRAAGTCDDVTVNVAAGDSYELISVLASMGADVVANTKTLNFAECVTGQAGLVTGLDLLPFTAATATAQTVVDIARTGNIVAIGDAATDEVSCPTGVANAVQTAGDLTVTFTFIMNGDATDPVVTIA